MNDGEKGLVTLLQEHPGFLDPTMRSMISAELHNLITRILTLAVDNGDHAPVLAHQFPISPLCLAYHGSISSAVHRFFVQASSIVSWSFPSTWKSAVPSLLAHVSGRIFAMFQVELLYALPV